MRPSCALVLCLTACASGARPEPSRPFVNTGDPLPERPVEDARCPAGVRWIATDPHDPFFVVGEDGVTEAGQPCCAPWSRPGSTWLTVGRYGEIAGKATLSGGEGYDVTQCYELSFDVTEGSPGVGLYVSEGWRPPTTSVRWEPTEPQRQALARFIVDAEKLLLPSPSDPPARSCRRPSSGSSRSRSRASPTRAPTRPWIATPPSAGGSS